MPYSAYLALSAYSNKNTNILYRLYQGLTNGK